MAKNRKTPDMNLPVWFDGQNINEALFCEEFLQESRIIFANRAFFTPNGRVTDDIVLRGEVYEKLKSYTISSVPQKIKNIMELLKLEAMVEDLPPQPDRIHVANGTLMLDGRFIEGKKEIVQSRLPVSYNPNAAAPETNCQGLFNQIHKKGARSTVWLLTPRLTDYIFPFSRSLQRYA